MAFWDRWLPRGVASGAPHTVPDESLKRRAMAAGPATEITSTFTDTNITYSGEQAGYDYESILRDKQKNINQLYQLSDYYTDADPIFRGIIKGVYTPFSIADDWQLIGANERVKQKYEDYYERIGLKDAMRSIFLQFYKYGNVFIYLKEDLQIITLPVHHCRIANVMVGGEPVVEFNCKQIRDGLRAQMQAADKPYLDDEKLEIRLDGFPPEVADALKKGFDWVQQDPENTFVLQDLKEDWMRYAVPLIATCLSALSKKSLITQADNKLLNLAFRSFVHASYGDAKNTLLPDREMLSAIHNVFKQAMTVSDGVPLATTNNFASVKTVQPDMQNMYEDDHNRVVNSEILAAGGISGIIVSGRAEDGSNFASAQVSMQTAALRIKQAKDNFCEMMNKINMRLNGGGTQRGLPRSSSKAIPKFTFKPVDLAGNKAFQETCFKLWTQGQVSTQTMLTVHGYDLEQEFERRENEQSEGIYNVMTPPGSVPAGSTSPPTTTGNDGPGRPAMDDTERSSDPIKGITGRQPKPSNPDGSIE